MIIKFVFLGIPNVYEGPSTSQCRNNNTTSRARKEMDTVHGSSKGSGNYIRGKKRTRGRHNKPPTLDCSFTESDSDIREEKNKIKGRKNHSLLGYSTDSQTDTPKKKSPKKRRHRASKKQTTFNGSSTDTESDTPPNKTTHSRCTKDAHSNNCTPGKNRRRSTLKKCPKVNDAGTDSDFHITSPKTRSKLGNKCNTVHSAYTQSDSDTPSNNTRRKCCEKFQYVDANATYYAKRKGCKQMEMDSHYGDSSAHNLRRKHSQNCGPSSECEDFNPSNNTRRRIFTQSDTATPPRKRSGTPCTQVPQFYSGSKQNEGLQLSIQCTHCHKFMQLDGPFIYGDSGMDAQREESTGKNNADTVNVHCMKSYTDPVIDQTTCTPVIDYYSYNCPHIPGSIHCNMAQQKHEVIVIDCEIENSIKTDNMTQDTNRKEHNEVMTNKSDSESHPLQTNCGKIGNTYDNHDVIVIDCDSETELNKEEPFHLQFNQKVESQPQHSNCDTLEKQHTNREVIVTECALDSNIKKEYTTQKRRKASEYKHPNHDIILIESDIEPEYDVKAAKELNPCFDLSKENHDVIVIEPMIHTNSQHEREEEAHQINQNRKMETEKERNVCTEQEWSSQADSLVKKLLNPQRLQSQWLPYMEERNECDADNEGQKMNNIEKKSLAIYTVAGKENVIKGKTKGISHSIKEQNSKIEDYLDTVNQQNGKNLCEKEIIHDVYTNPCVQHTLNEYSLSEKLSRDNNKPKELSLPSEEDVDNKLTSSNVPQGGSMGSQTHEMEDNGTEIQSEFTISFSVI